MDGFLANRAAQSVFSCERQVPEFDLTWVTLAGGTLAMLIGTHLRDRASQIKKLRKAKRLTQADLARRLFVDRTTVARWETGDRQPTEEHLTGMAKIFDEPLAVRPFFPLANQNPPARRGSGSGSGQAGWGV